MSKNQDYIEILVDMKSNEVKIQFSMYRIAWFDLMQKLIHND